MRQDQNIKKKLISFTIPVFNNEGSLLITYQEIKSLFFKTLSQFDYEIIFVNDGSKDNSLAEILQIRKDDHKVKVINFSRNFGQVAAMVAGARQAKGNALINISADLQDPVDKSIELIKEWENDHEIVICYRKNRNDGWISKFTSSIYFSMVQFHINENIPKGGFDYYLLDRKAIDSLNKINDKIRGLHYDILSLGYSKSYIAYERKERTIGKSQYNFIKRFRDFFNAFISISFIPIRFIIFIGFLTSFSGFGYTVWITWAWYFNKTPFEGWAPIMVMLLIIGGVIMLMLGIIGEYIWRIYEETKKRETYIIKDIFD